MIGRDTVRAAAPDTSATTDLAEAAGPAGVVYVGSELGAARYEVTAHPPTR